MVAAVSSSLDFSARNRLTMKRRARLTAPRVELALLRRLEQRYVDCDPAMMFESRVEQSFNDQLFARILGYRTLFSDAAAPFHLLPKNVTAGRATTIFRSGSSAMDRHGSSDLRN